MKLPNEWPYRVKSGNVQVPIYRSQTSRGYTEFKVVWTDAQKKRRFKTFADFGDAKKHAEGINEAIGTGAISAVTLSNEDRVIYERAKCALAEFATPLDTATIEYAQARKQLKGVPLIDAIRFYVHKHPRNFVRKTVSEAVKEMIETKRKDGLSPEYIRDLTMRLGHFSDSFAINVSDLTADLVNRFLRDELEDVSGRTRNNYRAAIGTLLGYAEAQGYIAKDQIELEHLARAKEHNFAIEIYTPEEIAKLLNAARLNQKHLPDGYNRRYSERQELVALLCLGGFAGLRTKEIQRQKWSDISLERNPAKLKEGRYGFVRVSGVKGNTAQRRLVPISRNLHEWLSKLTFTDGVCCEYPRPWEALERVAERAGVELKHNALRHSFISYRVAETQSVPQVALEAGNSVGMIHKHYRELVTSEAANEWFSVFPNMLAASLKEGFPAPVEILQSDS